ncbi:uncharacterized protein [Rutidosis leptorrhynchoides]|uniref:uncharacterized protein n=1 Tax=Rutidosis leptorrhynchoides TaxID=125765 RepID=UPI003A9A45D8
MALERPFLVNIYYGGNIEYVNGHVKHHNSTTHFTVVARDKIPYEQFLDLIYKHIGIEKQKCKLKVTMHFEHCGKPMSSPIMSDQTLDLMYFCAEKDEDFFAQVHVEREDIMLEKLTTPSNIGSTENPTPHTNLSESVPVVVPFPLPCDVRSESVKEFGERSSSLNAESDGLQDVSEERSALDVISVSPNTEGIDDEKNIRLGMRFESKLQMKNAVTLWSIAQNKEFKVVESRVNTWAAKCKLADVEKVKCSWCVRGLYKKSYKKWQITK